MLRASRFISMTVLAALCIAALSWIFPVKFGLSGDLCPADQLFYEKRLHSNYPVFKKPGTDPPISPAIRPVQARFTFLQHPENIEQWIPSNRFNPGFAALTPEEWNAIKEKWPSPHDVKTIELDPRKAIEGFCSIPIDKPAFRGVALNEAMVWNEKSNPQFS